MPNAVESPVENPLANEGDDPTVVSPVETTGAAKSPVENPYVTALAVEDASSSRPRPTTAMPKRKAMAKPKQQELPKPTVIKSSSSSEKPRQWKIDSKWLLAENKLEVIGLADRRHPQSKPPIFMVVQAFRQWRRKVESRSFRESEDAD